MVAVLVLRLGPGAGSPAQPIADTREPQPVILASPARGASRAAVYPQGSGEPESYVTPSVRPRLGVIPEGTLANYVVAHSQLSAPLAGRSVLIHLVADETRGGAPAP